MISSCIKRRVWGMFFTIHRPVNSPPWRNAKSTASFNSELGNRSRDDDHRVSICLLYCLLSSWPLPLLQEEESVEDDWIMPLWGFTGFLFRRRDAFPMFDERNLLPRPFTQCLTSSNARFSPAEGAPKFVIQRLCAKNLRISLGANDFWKWKSKFEADNVFWMRSRPANFKTTHRGRI